MKIIFLDVDGVINCRKTTAQFRKTKRMGIDPILVDRLNTILSNVDAQIVLSSTWRLFKGWRDTFKFCKIDVTRIIDVTPKLNSIRGLEIKAWLDLHPEVTKYAIVDDDSDMLPAQMPNFFQTTWDDGLTDDIVSKIIAHLL